MKKICLSDRYELTDAMLTDTITENTNSPREAYAALIDRISGKGTWDSNLYVLVYDFELVK